MSGELMQELPGGLPPGLTIRQAQAIVDQWIETVGVRYFSELTNLAQLMEEVGEVARILSRTHGEQSSKPGEPASELSDELADVLFVVICLANQTGVDLEAAFEKNLAKKTDRDAERHRDNPKLHSPNK
ncbi:MAG: nucleotide pyrophosphohydrolase [Pirellulaceae bacterium]